MANENIGEISCPLHARGRVTAFVRETKTASKKLYIACPECGLIAPRGGNVQKYIKEEAVMYDDKKDQEQEQEEINDAEKAKLVKSFEEELGYE